MRAQRDQLVHIWRRARESHRESPPTDRAASGRVLAQAPGRRVLAQAPGRRVLAQAPAGRA